MDKEYWEHRNFIEFCFKNEAKIIEAIWAKRLDPNVPKSFGHGSGISKPTEIQAIKNSMPLDFVNVDNTTVYHPDDWVHLIVAVKTYYNYKQGGILYFLRYFKQCQRKDILKEMKISKTRYHKLIIEIIGYAMEKIEKRNLKYGIVGVLKREC